MYAEARKFMPTVPDLVSRLRSTDASTSADIMVHFYDVGKQYFGEEKQQLFRFFALLYLVIWGKSAGPRFGEFAVLYGRDNFANLIEEKFAEAKTFI
jgi:lysyl-tRNA synthetase class 1